MCSSMIPNPRINIDLFGWISISPTFCCLLLQFWWIGAFTNLVKNAKIYRTFPILFKSWKKHHHLVDLTIDIKSASHMKFDLLDMWNMKPKCKPLPDLWFQMVTKVRAGNTCVLRNRNCESLLYLLLSSLTAQHYCRARFTCFMLRHGWLLRQWTCLFILH